MENLTSQVMKKDNEGVFDEFYLFYLHKLEESLEELFDKQFNFSFDKDKMVLEAICSLKKMMIEIGSKALLVEFQNFKEQNKKCGTYEDYVSYISGEEFHVYFDEKYVVLKDLLENKVKSFLELYEECLTRLSNDKKDIEESFGIQIESIKNISFDSDGDTHNGGKSVVQLDINGEQSLFYKPHTLGTDIVFKEIISLLEKRLDSFNFEHVKTIDKRDYGWQEKVEYKQSKSSKDLENFYYSIGVSLAIFYILGAEDIHSGNLISKGDMPAYIDLEILLGNKSKSFAGAKPDEKYGNLKNTFVDSVLGTFILPNNMPTNLIDIDLCALTSGQNLGKASEKLNYFGLVDKGTSNIHYEKKQSESYESLSIVRCDDKIVDADAYIEEIAEGFKAAYQIIAEEKEAIFEIMKTHKDERIRQVVRATYIYGKFLDAAYHPKYLQEKDERKRVIDLIHGNKSKHEVMSEIADKESEMLYRDDVPYFYTTFSSNDLYYLKDGKECAIKNAFTNSLEDALTTKLNSLSEHDMNKQVDLIYASFANFGKNRFQTMEKQDKNLLKKLKAEKSLDLPYRYVKAIYESLLEKVQESDDIAIMVGLEPDITDAYRINFFSGNLYNGLGTVYFMGLADKMFGGKNAEKILKLIRGIETINPYKLVPVSIGSAFNGLVGRLYVYDQFYKQTGLKDYLNYYNEITDYLVNTDVKKDDVIDYVTGICGGIVALVNLYNENKDDRLKKIIKKYKGFLRAKIKKLDYVNTLNGMAHGYSGFIMALFKIYEFSGEKYFYKKAVELVKQENKSFSPDHGNWQDTRDGSYDITFWCHGASGIGLTRAATLKYIKDDEKLKAIWLNDIKSAISMIRKNGTNFDIKHSICHGVMGNLIILDYLANTMDDQDSKAFIKDELTNFLTRLEVDAIHYENPLNVPDIGFMLGLSGIGYSIMKLIDKDITNVLLLEV